MKRNKKCTQKETSVHIVSGLVIYAYTKRINRRRVSNRSKNTNANDKQAKGFQTLLQRVVTFIFFKRRI